MAPDAISQILRVAVLAQYIGYRVRVASVTSVCQQTRGMAGTAGRYRTPRHSMIQRESSMRPFVCRRLPPNGCVAFDAVLAEHTLVGVIFLMTRIAGSGRPFEYTIYMARNTRHRHVGSG